MLKLIVTMNLLVTGMVDHARATYARRDDDTGASAVEWVLIVLATIAIVGVVGAAIRAYINARVGELGS